MKIAIDRVLVEQVLEALEADNSKLWPSDRRTAAYFNLRAALESPVEEPVAWSHINGTSDTKWYPPQRKPLTDEEIKRLVSNDMVQFARAIERAHGI